MKYKPYGERIENEPINLNYVSIGMGTRGSMKSWVFLENIDNGVFADIESLTIYKTEIGEPDILNVVKSRVNKLVTKLTPTRHLDTITEVKSLRELFAKSKLFFDTLEKEGFNEEILRVREIYSRYQPLFDAMDRGEDVYLTAYELNSILDTLKRMYTYAFGAPMNEEAKIKLKNYDLIDPFDEYYMETLFMAKADGNKDMILDLMFTNIGGADKGISLYQDMKTGYTYYVNEKDEVVTPSRLALEYRAKTDVERFTNKIDFLEALAVANGNPDMFNESEWEILQTLPMEYLYIEIRDINRSERLFKKCYNIANGTEYRAMDHKPSIVEDFSDMGDLLSVLELKICQKHRNLS